MKQTLVYFRIKNVDRVLILVVSIAKIEFYLL